MRDARPADPRGEHREAARARARVAGARVARLRGDRAHPARWAVLRSARPRLITAGRGLVFETVTVCAVTLLPPLTVSTLMAPSPTMFRHAALMGPAGVALGILQALLGLLLVRYILFARGETPADIGFRPGLRPVLESVPLVGVAYAGALLTALALHGSVMAEAATQRARTAFMSSSAPLTFVYVIVGPLFEETIVRAYLMTRLTTLGLSTPTVVLASAVLQTAYHTYQGLAWALVYLPIFLTFAVYFAWRRNAVAPALSHITVDLVAWAAIYSGLAR